MKKMSVFSLLSALALFVTAPTSVLASASPFVFVDSGQLPPHSLMGSQSVEAFYIGRFEVTWGQWQEVREWAISNGYEDLANVGTGSGQDHPVRLVNWYDVVKWCNAKSEKDGLTPCYYEISNNVYRNGEIAPIVDSSANGYRLPTEAEWEWAARGAQYSNNYIYSGSNDLNSVAWYLDNSDGDTHQVGSKASNEIGIYDMSGNVWEWCEDLGPDGRRFRGGCWTGVDSITSAEYCSFAYRDLGDDPANRAGYGLRVARNAPKDTDSDGVNDYREFQDGTDINDPNSFNPLSKGLVAYYPFNGNADDDSGFENNGSVFGAELAADRFSQPASAYMFERANPDRIEVPWSVDTAQGVTCLSFWLLDTSPDGATGFILSGEAEYDWSVHIAATNKVRFLPSPPVGGGGTAIDSTEPFVQGEWNHILCMSGTTSDDRGIWINGRKVASIVSDGNDTEPSAHVSSKLWIGGRQIWPGNQDHYFNGLVDDVRIYNRPLSKNEIQQLFYSESFNDSQRQFLALAPAVMGHYSQTEYEDFGALRLSNGVSSVLTNPSAFNLFTQNEYESFGALQFSNGISSVISNPAAFNLFTQAEFNSNRTAGQSDVMNSPMSFGLYTSNSIMDLRMGGLMIQRQGTNAVVSFQPQTTTDLTQPFTNNGTPITNTIPMPGNKGFLRVRGVGGSFPGGVGPGGGAGND